MHISTLILPLLPALAHALPGGSAPTYGGGHGEAPYFYKGYDLSSLKIMEDGGAIYKNAQEGNVTMPVEEILTGMNTVRLRLWVDPVVPFDDGCESCVFEP